MLLTHPHVSKSQAALQHPVAGLLLLAAKLVIELLVRAGRGFRMGQDDQKPSWRELEGNAM